MFMIKYDYKFNGGFQKSIPKQYLRKYMIVNKKNPDINGISNL
jgi:hypothetical protein